MATNTTNYGWTKPSYEDAADIEIINGTIDNIDAQVKTVETALDSKADATDIPTVPITAIQKNGTGITPVGGTVNITVPTQASDINAATAAQGGKADTAIQGVKVNSSTVNPDSNKVVSITVPTTAAEVSALPNSTKYAASLSLEINSSTFVVTGQLKDQNGNNLGTAQTIDLPLESVVVGGSYDDTTKKVVLTLQSGSTVEFSVADLVAGLQTELSATNKLNPAYIDYDSTHRAVSDTEKSAWNGKQSALTTAQLAAVNSGIDSTKVAQIATNADNEAEDRAALVELVDSGEKNLIQNGETTRTVSGVTFTANSDGSVSLSGTASANITSYLIVPSQSIFEEPCVLSGCPSGGSDGTYKLDMLAGGGGGGVLVNDYGTGALIDWTLFVSGTFSVRIRIANGTDTTGLVFKPMICTVPAWKVSQAYQPYRPSYQELYERVIALEQANA